MLHMPPAPPAGGPPPRWVHSFGMHTPTAGSSTDGRTDAARIFAHAGMIFVRACGLNACRMMAASEQVNFTFKFHTRVLWNV